MGAARTKRGLDTPPPPSSGLARALLATFGCAFVARALHLWALSSAPYLDGLVVDALGYEEDAQGLVSRGAFPDVFYRPPLYIFIRAALSGVAMDGARPLSILHCTVGAVTASLIALTTWRLCASAARDTRLRATWIAGLMAALYGPLIVGDVELLPSAWVHVLLALSLALVASPADRLRFSDAVAGLSLGLAITGWGPAAAFILPVALLRLRGAPPPQRIQVAAVLLLAVSAAPGLSAAHNAQHGAPGTVVSANVGINLWLGNNPNWQRTWAAGPGLYFDREQQRPRREGALTWAQQERWFVAAVWETVQRDPAAAALRVLEKFGCALHGTEISRDHNRQWLRDQSLVAAVTWFDLGIRFPFGLLLPLALWCPRKRLHAGAYAALLAGCIGYALVLAVFFVALRYRLLMALLLIPLAAHACAARLRGVTRLQWAAGGLALLLCNVPNALAERVGATPVQELIRLRQSFMSQGDAAAALQAAWKAVRHDPEDADAQVALGLDLLTAGALREAFTHLEKATALLPDSEAAWHYFGNGCIAVQDYERAIASFQRALAINPYHASSYRDLARTQLELGQLDAALETTGRARRAGYWDGRLVHDLANELASRGRASQARALMQQLSRAAREGRAEP